MRSTAFSRMLRFALDLALPVRCLGCGEIVTGNNGLCMQCWSGLPWISEPFCASCGIPFDFAIGEDGQCVNCLKSPPIFTKARAALIYDVGSRDILLRFKHVDRTDAAPLMARMMARAGADLLKSADYLIPVPLHWKRLWSRRYNQAALLARELGKISGKPSLMDALIRVQATPSQGHRSIRERAENVATAFAITGSGTRKIAGSRILLIDDVLTTGATVNACARVLKEASVKHIDVLTFARTKKE